MTMSECGALDDACRSLGSRNLDLGLGHRYRLDRLVSRSTCGDLWHATWEQTGSLVMLKTLRADLSDSDQAAHAQTLLAEGEHLRRLAHRHIVRYQRSDLWQGAPVLVMERLHESLRDWLLKHSQATGRSSVNAGQALAWARQVGLALQAMHRSGRKHLDLKPTNLLLTKPDAHGHQSLKLADFGACMPIATVGHEFVGTPGWAAPEQMTPVKASGQARSQFFTNAGSDWYALGQLLHRLLFGRLSPAGEATLGRFQQAGLVGLLAAGTTPADHFCDSGMDDAVTWNGSARPGSGSQPGSGAVAPRLPLHSAKETCGGGLEGVDSLLKGLLSASPLQRLDTAARWLQAPPPI